MPYDPRKLTNGSPQKMSKPSSRPVPNTMSNVVSGTRTGDAVSDESDNEEEGEAETPEDHEDASSSDDDDEADVFALSGANRKGNIATSRLAGPTCMIETDAVAGAEEDTDSDDEEGYDVLDDEDDEDDEDDGIEKVLEKDLIQDFLDEEAEAGAKRAQATTSSRPQTATSVSNEMTGLSIVEDAALARRLSLQSEDSNGGDLDWSEDPFQGLQTNDSLYQELIEDAEDDFSYDLASWRVTDETVNEDNLFELQPAGNEKRVRFAETVSSRSSSLSSEDDPRDAYPDLFDGTSTPQSRSQYMMDIDPIDDDNDDNESIFDFDYVDPYENEPVNMYNDEESDSDGETTDECMHNISLLCYDWECLLTRPKPMATLQMRKTKRMRTRVCTPFTNRIANLLQRVLWSHLVLALPRPAHQSVARRQRDSPTPGSGRPCRGRDRSPG